jgi:imidazolonepropionase-like amidohydrolase
MRWEFSLMTDEGMAPATALLVGTREASKLLGVDGDAGTFEPGKRADIVVVPGNVLKGIHATEHPLFVIKDGVVVVNKVAASH